MTAGARDRGPRLHETSVELEVPFHHVDALRIVWHGRYFEYFEHARTALMRSRGLDVPDLAALRVRLVVVESGCRHVFPLYCGDRVRVTAWFQDFARRLLVRYELTNLTHGRIAARGHTALASLNDEGGLRLETPPDIVRRIEGASGGA